jgi:hypothetical protein
MDTVHPEIETLHIWLVDRIVINGCDNTLKKWLPVDFQCPKSAFVSEAKSKLPTHFHRIANGEEGRVRFVGIEEKWAIPLDDPRKQ